MKRLLFIAGLILLVAVAFSLYFKNGTKPAVTIAGQTLLVTIADTPEKITQGLSGSVSLPKNTGMLFVFETSSQHGFWMKDMNYSIDILWLDEEGKIIHIEKNISLETFPEVFTPSAPALYVLEVNAGFVDGSEVKIGDLVKLPENKKSL